MAYTYADDGRVLDLDALDITIVWASAGIVDYMQVTNAEGLVYKQFFTYNIDGDITSVSKWRLQS